MNRQYLEPIEYYLSRDFDQAAEFLTLALDNASAMIAANPAIGHDFPSVYRKLVWPGVKWIKVHRYWFSYTTKGEPVIFNVLWHASDIPSRAVPPSGEEFG